MSTMQRSSRYQTTRQGLALLSVLILMMTLALIGAASMYITRSQIELWEQQVRREQAYTCAEAGIQHALWRVRVGQDPNGTTYNCVMNGRTYAVGFTTSTSGWTTQINASVTY